MKATILVVGGERANIKQELIQCMMQGYEVEIEDNDAKEYEHIIHDLGADITVRKEKK
jgi:hypothetical protein